MLFAYLLIVTLLQGWTGLTEASITWTTLTRGTSTDYETFDPTISLIQYRFTKLNSTKPLTGWFYVNTWFYTTADSHSYIGSVRIQYYLSGGNITSSSYVRLYVARKATDCYDRTMLLRQNELAGIVTLNLTTEHAATIGNAHRANFTSCSTSRYTEWVKLIKSDTITRVKFKYSTGAGIAGDDLTVQYKLSGRKYTMRFASLNSFYLVDMNGNRTEDGAGLLLYNGGTVCGNYFTNTSAEVICRLMGYNGTAAWKQGKYSPVQSKHSIILEKVECSYNVMSSCTYTTPDKCAHNEGVYLTCTPRVSPASTGLTNTNSCLPPVWVLALAAVSIFAIGIILGIIIIVVVKKYKTANKDKSALKVAYHVKRSDKDEIPGEKEDDDGIYTDMDENEKASSS